jgi:F0F1-type ATP synthase epsilon subunit
MRVFIYSLEKILYEGEAKSLTTKTSLGEITVLDHHRPLITDILKSILKIIDNNGKEHYFNVSTGFLEVNNLNEVRALIFEN